METTEKLLLIPEVNLQVSEPAHAVDDCRNKLLNISIVSAEAQDFIKIKRKSSEELLSIRPTLHVTQITPFGELKTTTASRIEKYISEHRVNHPYLKVSSVTAAAIAGSIDEKLKVTPPLPYNFLNGTIVIDEPYACPDNCGHSKQSLYYY